MLSGGHDSLYQVVYISDILPRSVAAREESLHALDIIHYINGASTQGMSLKEAKRSLETSLPKVVLKATRYVFMYVLSFCTSVQKGTWYLCFVFLGNTRQCPAMKHKCSK